MLQGLPQKAAFPDGRRTLLAAIRFDFRHIDGPAATPSRALALATPAHAERYYNTTKHAANRPPRFARLRGISHGAFLAAERVSFQVKKKLLSNTLHYYSLLLPHIDAEQRQARAYFMPRVREMSSRRRRMSAS